MSIWGRIFASSYDHVMARTEKDGLGARRRELLASAAGDVLEIGGGTGANLPCYGERVTSLTITEPEPPMARRLERRLHDEASRASLIQAPAEALPFADDSFDTVVSTLVLCTVSDQRRALDEVRRVLRPDGRLLFIEHVRSADERVARWQDRMLPVNRRLAHGCRCNRSTLDQIRGNGFALRRIEHGQLKHVPPFVRPLIVGEAGISL